MKIVITMTILLFLILTLIFHYYRKRGFWYPFRDWKYIDPLSHKGPTAKEVHKKYRELTQVLKGKKEIVPLEISLYEWQTLLSILRGLRKKYDQSPKNKKAEVEYKKFQALILKILIDGIGLSWKVYENHFLLHDLTIWGLSSKVFQKEMLVTLLEKEARDILNLTNEYAQAKSARMFRLFLQSKKLSFDNKEGVISKCCELSYTVTKYFTPLQTTTMHPLSRPFNPLATYVSLIRGIDGKDRFKSGHILG